MKHILKPDIYIKTALELNMDDLWERGIRGVVLDVDNTLVPHNSMEVTPSAREFVQRLKDRGFQIIVLSNNHEERVAPLAKELGLSYEFDCFKPKKKFYRTAMEKMGTAPESTVAIGDQFLTDVWGGNRSGLLTVLVHPIVEANETKFIVLKRKYEKHLYKKFRLEEE